MRYVDVGKWGLLQFDFFFSLYQNQLRSDSQEAICSVFSCKIAFGDRGLILIFLGSPQANQSEWPKKVGGFIEKSGHMKVQKWPKMVKMTKNCQNSKKTVNDVVKGHFIPCSKGNEILKKMSHKS